MYRYELPVPDIVFEPVDAPDFAADADVVDNPYFTEDETALVATFHPDLLVSVMYTVYAKSPEDV